MAKAESQKGAEKMVPADAAAAPASAEDDRQRVRYAIIFVPGLAVTGEDSKRPASVATRLTEACEVQSIAAAEFSTQWHDAAVQRGRGGLVATLRRVEDDRNDPVVDVYSHEWSDRFIDRWRAQKLPMKLIKMLLVLLRAPVFIRFFRTSGKKNPRGRAQLVVALVMVLACFAYAAVTAVAAVQAVQAAVEQVNEDPSTDEPATATDQTEGAPQSDEGATSAPVSDGGGNGSTGTLTWQQWFAALGALVLILWKSLRTRLTSAGEALVAAHGYLRLDEGTNESAGELTKLVEQVSVASPEAEIVVMGYSFGALVGIDTLYPAQSEPARVLDRVTSFVTIGAPYDLARAVRKGWDTQGRYPARSGLGRWVNMFSPIDLLGSNFRNATPGVEPELQLPTVASDQAGRSAVIQPTVNERWGQDQRLSFLEVLALYGFSVHGLYWTDNDRPSRNVFERVAVHLFEGTDVLAPPGASVASPESADPASSPERPTDDRS